MKTKCWIFSRPTVPGAVVVGPDVVVVEPAAVLLDPPLVVEGEARVLEDAVVLETLEAQAPTRRASPATSDPQTSAATLTRRTDPTGESILSGKPSPAGKPRDDFPHGFADLQHFPSRASRMAEHCRPNGFRRQITSLTRVAGNRFGSNQPMQVRMPTYPTDAAPRL